MGASERAKLNPTSLISIELEPGEVPGIWRQKKTHNNPPPFFFLLLPLFILGKETERLAKEKRKEEGGERGKKEECKVPRLHSPLGLLPMPPADPGRVRALCETAALPASLSPSPPFAAMATAEALDLPPILAPEYPGRETPLQKNSAPPPPVAAEAFCRGKTIPGSPRLVFIYLNGFPFGFEMF